MTNAPIARKTMRDYRGPASAILIVMVAVAVLDLAIYPSYHDALKDFQTPGALSGFVGEAGSLTSPIGFITAEFFSWVPLMLAAFVIVAGTGVTIGEESSGALDVLLTQPVGRTRVLLEKTLGLVLSVTLVCVVSWVGFAVMKLFVSFDVSQVRLFAALVNMLPVTWLFLALGLAAGVLFPSRGGALMSAFGLMIAAYVVYTIGSAVNSLHTVRKASPFYWSDGSQVLLHGFGWGRAAVFVLLAVALVGVAAVAFERRDITTVHEWRAPKLMGRWGGRGRLLVGAPRDSQD